MARKKKGITHEDIKWIVIDEYWLTADSPAWRERYCATFTDEKAAREYAERQKDGYDRILFRVSDICRRGKRSWDCYNR